MGATTSLPARPKQIQQTVHVADLAGAVLAAVERSTPACTSYDVADPAPLTFADLLRIFADTVGSRGRPVPAPLAPVVVATCCYERLGRRPRMRAEQLQRLAEDKPFAIDDAVPNLGDSARPFADRALTDVRALGLAL
jgi:nucleoside-diphosphate-sugar epimerase